jgi:hypothetical protein
MCSGRQTPGNTKKPTKKPRSRLRGFVWMQWLETHMHGGDYAPSMWQMVDCGPAEM